MSSSTPVDKKGLYGTYSRGEAWRDRLSRKLAHKALDLVDGEEMQVDNSRHGFGWKEIIALGGLVLGAAYLFGMIPSKPPVTPPAAATPAAQTLEPLRGKIRFWVEDPNVTIEEAQP